GGNAEIYGAAVGVRHRANVFEDAIEIAAAFKHLHVEGLDNTLAFFACRVHKIKWLGLTTVGARQRKIVVLEYFLNRLERDFIQKNLRHTVADAEHLGIRRIADEPVGIRALNA